MAMIQALNDTYVTFRRFSMPSGNSTVDAIALSETNGVRVVSAYTLMIQWAIIHFWSVLVFAAVTFLMKKPGRPHDFWTALAEIWNERSSPESVGLITLKFAYLSKTSRLIGLAWALVAFLFVAMNIAGPILLPDLLVIGNAAPVNSSAVFVPTYNQDNIVENSQYNLLQTAAAFRAVGVTSPLNAVNVTTSGNLTVDYNYSISGSDFGLQVAPDLLVNIRGACFTEYSWVELASETSYLDIYYPYDVDSPGIIVTSNSSGPPFAGAVNTPMSSNLTSPGNYSYAIYISSVGRLSNTSSTDPWYLTGPIESPNARFQVLPGRPVLSCWETNSWTYQGLNADIEGLPSLNLPPAILAIFQQYLSRPVLFQMVTLLNRSSLKSSTTAIRSLFEASISSIYEDMQRLVAASYVKTLNIFVESTMYENLNTTALSNLMVSPDGSLLAGVDNFVVYTPGVLTFSVRAVIIVPSVLLGLLIITLLLGMLPGSYRTAHALFASVLYSNLHQAMADKRKSENEVNNEATNIDEKAMEDGVSGAERQTEVQDGKTGYNCKSVVARNPDTSPSPLKPAWSEDSGHRWVSTDEEYVHLLLHIEIYDWSITFLIYTSKSSWHNMVQIANLFCDNAKIDLNLLILVPILPYGKTSRPGYMGPLVTLWKHNFHNEFNRSGIQNAVQTRHMDRRTIDQNKRELTTIIPVQDSGYTCDIGIFNSCSLLMVN